MNLYKEIKENQNETVYTDIPTECYRYITNHGIGPGTLPKDITLCKSEDLESGKTAIYVDRPLTDEELKYYDIKPEHIQENNEVSMSEYTMDTEEEKWLYNHFVNDEDFKSEFNSYKDNVEGTFEDYIKEMVGYMLNSEADPYLDKEYLDIAWLRNNDTGKIYNVEEFWALYKINLEEDIMAARKEEIKDAEMQVESEEVLEDVVRKEFPKDFINFKGKEYESFSDFSYGEKERSRVYYINMTDPETGSRYGDPQHSDDYFSVAYTLHKVGENHYSGIDEIIEIEDFTI